MAITPSMSVPLTRYGRRAAALRCAITGLYTGSPTRAQDRLAGSVHPREGPQPVPRRIPRGAARHQDSSIGQARRCRIVPPPVDRAPRSGPARPLGRRSRRSRGSTGNEHVSSSSSVAVNLALPSSIVRGPRPSYPFVGLYSSVAAIQPRPTNFPEQHPPTWQQRGCMARTSVDHSLCRGPGPAGRMVQLGGTHCLAVAAEGAAASDQHPAIPKQGRRVRGSGRDHLSCGCRRAAAGSNASVESRIRPLRSS